MSPEFQIILGKEERFLNYNGIWTVQTYDLRHGRSLVPLIFHTYPVTKTFFCISYQ